MSWEIHNGDAIDVLREMAPGSIDAIVTDPPYGLGFMGKAWDALPPGEELGKLMLEVAKPGAHLVAFGGTRTYHRLVVALEDAGWEIRDQLAWVYGSGFPKSLDVSKAIDKAAGAEREVVGVRDSYRPVANATRDPEGFQDRSDGAITAPATDAARQWSGWGTALKPAWEPIVLARKPLGGTVAANVLEHGTGALNVDGCRVGTDGGTRRDGKADQPNAAGWENMRGHKVAELNAGRWPANLAHDGSPEATAGMGDAARYYYTAKASSAERNAGLEGMAQQFAPTMGNGIGAREHDPQTAPRPENHHPTVKPIALMRWLCRLVTPPGGLILDPFLGSGSTMVAALQEGFRCVGIERESQYADIARRRVEEDAPLFNRGPK